MKEGGRSGGTEGEGTIEERGRRRRREGVSGEGEGVREERKRYTSGSKSVRSELEDYRKRKIRRTG